MVRKSPKNFRASARKKAGAPTSPRMATASAEIGRIIIAPEVLATVARSSALSVPGVVGMSSLVMGSFNRFLKRGPTHQGVRLEVKDGELTIDLYLVAGTNVDLYAMGQAVQRKVARAIPELVGMQVGAVNVHIEEIAFPSTPPKRK